MSIVSTTASDEPIDFSLKNLQPINYLKTFNKMLDYMSKTPSSALVPPQKQLKTVRLSKFPLHGYYYQMQGILESSNKKNHDQQKQNRQQIQFEKYQQKFLDNHYKFVKDTLEKIIQDNQSQQQNLQKSQNFYKLQSLIKSGPNNQTRPLRLIKLRSQPKLKSIQSSINFNLKNKKQQSQASLNNFSLKRKETINHQSKNTEYSLKQPLSSRVAKLQQQHNPIFKKLLPPKKNDKFRTRNFQQIDSLLAARKTFQEKKQKINNQNKLYPLTERNEKKYQSTGLKHSLKNGGKSDHNYNKNKDSHNEKLTQNNQRQIQNKKGFSSITENCLNKYIRTSKFSHQNEQQNEQSFHLFNQKDFLDFKKQFTILPEEKQVQDEDTKFFKQLQCLKEEKTKLQNQYEERIDNKIKQVKHKLNERIKQVIKFDYSIPKLQSQKLITQQTNKQY